MPSTVLLDIITTGGTIGGSPYPDPRHPPPRTDFPEKGNPVEEFLKTEPRGLAPGDYTLFEFLPVDSKDIGEWHIATIVQRLTENNAPNVLITHGTDTILNTAALLHDHPAAKGKRIILVGAMTPLLNGDASDGYQNLLFAIRHLMSPLDSTPAGVSIVLSDFGEAPGSWEPRLYPFLPGRYRKEYNCDRGDRSRLVDADQFV
jgi:L-asparaginase/Glu-tRNA(Gln) amidotransferase subunit D